MTKKTTTTDPGFEADLLAAGAEPAVEMPPRLSKDELAKAAEEVRKEISAAAQPLPNARIAAAIVRAQRKFKVAIKDADNPYFKSKYATLGDCWDAVKDALADEGLAVLQPTCDNQGRICVETRIVHESGEMLTSLYPVVCAKQNDPQAMGSAITYARRYALSAFLGIIADIDDDAEAATIHTVLPPPPKRPATPQPSQEEIETAIQCLEMAQCRADVDRLWKEQAPRLGKIPAFLEACKAAAARFPKDKEIK